MPRVQPEAQLAVLSDDEASDDDEAVPPIFGGAASSALDDMLAQRGAPESTPRAMGNNSNNNPLYDAEEDEAEVQMFAGNAPRSARESRDGGGGLDDGRAEESAGKDDGLDLVDMDEDDDVGFLGMDDNAEDIVGRSIARGGGIDPEVEARVTKMVELLKTLKEKNKRLREGQARLRAENAELKKEIERAEEAKDEAELKAERELRLMQFKNSGAPGSGGRNLQAELDAQRKRDEARRQMYTNEGEDDEIVLGQAQSASNRGLARRILARFNAWTRKHYPLNNDLRRIDARFGSSVAAYFAFSRWMISNYIVLTLVCLVFLVMHITALLEFQGLDQAQREARYNTAGEPFAYYSWTAEDWGLFSSFLPKFLMPSSFNPGDTGTLYFATSTGQQALLMPNGTSRSAIPYSSAAEMGERMPYINMLVVCNFLLLGSALLKWIREDRKAKAFGMFEELDRQSKFAQASLNVWDHSLAKPREVEDLKSSLLEQFFVMVHELDTANLKESRTLYERSVLLLRRFLSNLIYVGVQGSSAYAIVLLTAQSSQMSQDVLQAVSSNPSLQWLEPVVTLLSGSIVPIAVSGINALLPTIVTKLTTFERWDDGGFFTKLMLFRLFVAKTLNALIQIFSFLQLLDPFLLRGNPVAAIISDAIDRSTRTNTEKRLVGVGSAFATGPSPSGMNICRADAYGAGIFQLVLTEFVVSKVAFFAGPAGQWLVFRKILKRPRDKPEFVVAKHMVDLLFFQQLCFLSFPFFPFGTIIVMIMMFAGFKVQSLTLMAFMAKPKKPWSAKDAANFFIKFFFFTLAVSFSITFFVLSNTFLPKACTLQEQGMRETYASYNASSNPLSQCFSQDVAGSTPDVCFLAGRTVGQVLSGEGRSPGLEELRFWEEYFVARDSSLASGPATAQVNTEQRLRALTGFESPEAVSEASLLVCSLACGPFVFSTHAYAPLHLYLDQQLSTAYSLATQSPVFVWAVAVVLLLRYLFVTNTVGVLLALQQEKELTLRNLVSNLEAKIAKMRSKLSKLKG